MCIPHRLKACAPVTKDTLPVELVTLSTRYEGASGRTKTLCTARAGVLALIKHLTYTLMLWEGCVLLRSSTYLHVRNTYSLLAYIYFIRRVRLMLSCPSVVASC
jgi:hypothetical protein